MLNNILKNSLVFTFIGLSNLTAYAASCNPSPTAIRSAPDSRYKIINDGTEVKDKRTGLIWQRCAIGRVFDGNECTGVSEVYNWKKLLALDESLDKEARVNKISGKKYRVPTIKEMESLIEIACPKIAVNTTAFPNTQSWFKSSTSDYNNNDRSLDILFMNGAKDKRYPYPKETSGGHIRLVRDE